MKLEVLRNLLLCGAAAALASCGGGGGGGMNFIPSPPPPPPPSPPPPPPPPTSLIAPAHLGLVSSAPFAVLATGDTYTTDASGQHQAVLTGPSAVDVQFSYDGSTNSYRISLPGFHSGTLTETAYNGTVGGPASSSTSKLMEDSFGFVLPVSIFLPVPGTSRSPFTYTSFGWWSGQSGTTATGDKVFSEGIFAYGIPTASGDVPLTGSASYSAQINASSDAGTFEAFPVGGSADLLFNFGAGTLSGSMHPRIIDELSGLIADFGKYDFTQTVYSTGSTTFSGKFVVPGLPAADSFFEGRFTGPGGPELMARFRTPYILGGHEGALSGVWIGKKN